MNSFNVENDNFQIHGMTCVISEEAFLTYLDSLFEEEKVQEIIMYLKSKNIMELFVLKGIYVDPKKQGLGIGGKALNEVFLTSAGLPVLLVCDNLEPQNGSFKLQEWYESKGFTCTGINSLSGPLMIKF